ncbi:MAG: hypothetical protein LBR72_04630, partial [Oscillospiraceae bacterium]|nr:hypothetical protein [Oscillospiraceae bacterium]
MKIFFSHHGKRLLSLALIVCLASQLGVPAFAAEDKPKLLLPTVEVPPEILAGSLFYIKTTDANLAENAGAVYLLPIGRGGDPSGPASVSVRISDMTAKYGSDYLVRFRGKKPLNPPDNESILEIIAESSENGELTESPFVSEEEFADLLESVEDPAIEEPAVEEPVAEPPAEEEYTIEALPAFEETLVPGNPINAAKELYSGRPSDRVPMTTDGDMLTQLQEMADMMTLSVVGATIEVPFAPGESEVFLELEPLDNGDSDGDRSFMVMLSEGYGGTNSALANSLFTITDDEAYRPALFSFTEPVYNEADGEAAVTIAREGAIESTVSVRLATKDAGSAVAGRDYAPVNAEVFFPFGVTERTVKIPVKNQYLPGGGSFYLSLANPAGGEIAGGDAEVILSGSAAALEPEETAVPVQPFATIPDNAASLGTLIRPISYQQLGSVMKMDQNLLSRWYGNSDESLASGGSGDTLSSGLLTVNMGLRNKDARKPITAGQKKTYT